MKFYESDRATIYHGDCIEILKTIPGESIDAVVTDPPYGLEFMGKSWDAPWKASGTVLDDPAAVGGFQDGEGGNPFSRSRIRYGREGDAMRGFQDWCEQWAAECLRVLKPGGHMLAFGGTRTWHRLAVAVEESGFEIRDNLAWIYASGFPKSRNVSEAMERFVAAGPQDPDGKQREIRPGVYEVTRFLREARDRAGWSNKRIDALFGTNGMAGHWTSQATQPAVPSVRQWQELKTVLGFDDSMDELVAELASNERPDDWGSGGGDGGPFLAALSNDPDATSDAEWGTALKPAFEPIVVGRKPVRGTIEGNVLTHGTGALHIGACRTGTSGGGNACPGGDDCRCETSGVSFSPTKHPVRREGEYGRYPTNLLLDMNQAAALDVQSGERPAGGKVTGNQTAKTGDSGIYGSYGAIENRPYNDSGGASRFFFVVPEDDALDKLEARFKYTAKPDRSERVRIGGVAHPTVKPLDLMRWLVRLVTPPDGTVLEPFAGSGTTVEACHLEGVKVVAIEQGEEYLPLIVQRLNRRQDPVAAVKAAGDDAGLFDLLEEGA